VRIELIDQNSTSITHRAVKFARVTKCKDYNVTYFNFIVQVLPYRCSFYAWLPIAMKRGIHCVLYYVYDDVVKKVRYLI